MNGMNVSSPNKRKKQWVIQRWNSFLHYFLWYHVLLNSNHLNQRISVHHGQVHLLMIVIYFLHFLLSSRLIVIDLSPVDRLKSLSILFHWKVFREQLKSILLVSYHISWSWVYLSTNFLQYLFDFERRTNHQIVVYFQCLSSKFFIGIQQNM